MPIKTFAERVEGFKQYWEYWEKSPGESLILYTEDAVYLQDKKFFDDVKVIVNAFDLLSYHYALPSELKRTFEGAFCKVFKVDGFELSAFKNFGEQENF